MDYSFRLTARVLLYAPSHRQDSTYHGLCYTSRGVEAGSRNSSMGSPHEGSIRRPIAPWANALTTELHLAPLLLLLLVVVVVVVVIVAVSNSSSSSRSRPSSSSSRSISSNSSSSNSSSNSSSSSSSSSSSHHHHYYYWTWLGRDNEKLFHVV